MISRGVPISRKIERKELIALFAGLAPGTEICYEEILVGIGLDQEKSGDRNLIYAVREHCRDVLGFVVEAIAGRGYRRVLDSEIAGKVVERRRDRIYRQSVRGAAESVAIGDWAALSRDEQLRVLAHQSVFGAVALATHDGTLKELTNGMRQTAIPQASTEEVLRAIAAIKQ